MGMRKYGLATYARMSDYELLKDSLRHWYRMRKWVRSKDSLMAADMASMQAAIGEAWDGDSCPCCCAVTANHRRPCPVAGKVCIDFMCVREWCQVASANTWGEWLKWSDAMVALLRSRMLTVRREEKEYSKEIRDGHKKERRRTS